MSATKESILSCKALGGLIQVPEWGGEVYVRVMSGTERDAYEDETYRLNGRDVSLNRRNLRARLLVKCIADEAGNRVFSDAEADALGATPAPQLDRVYSFAAKLNGLSAKDEEDLAGNSDGAPA